MATAEQIAIAKIEKKLEEIDDNINSLRAEMREQHSVVVEILTSGGRNPSH